MSLLKKIFCCHKWKSHHKKEIEIDYYQINNFYKILPELHSTFTRETLICENCGKIIQIKL